MAPVRGRARCWKILLDVRNPAELQSGQFKDFSSYPLDQLRDRIDELDPAKEYIVSCHSGLLFLHCRTA